MQKMMVLIQGDFVAPRFDQATEILIVRVEDGREIGQPQMIIMDRASDEELCRLAVEENITNLVCGGIEQDHFDFLAWKKVTVVDGVIGSWRVAVKKGVAGSLRRGEILPPENDGPMTL